MVAINHDKFLVLALCSLAFLAAAAGEAQAATYGNNSYAGGNDSNLLGQSRMPTAQPQTFDSGLGTVAVQGYVSQAEDLRELSGSLMPVAGARLFFVYNNQVVAQATTNPVGFYSVTLPAGSDYTVAVTAIGFQTTVEQADFSHMRTYNIGLTPIPFNGFVPYALYPVLESSPGREFDCTIVVQNYQVIDQMVTFTVITPLDVQAWFPLGEAMMVRSGDSDVWTFRLKYVGTAQGPQVIKVVVNGGAYFAEIPVIVVIKDLPFEQVSLWSYAPEKVVKPGDTVAFAFNAENTYAMDKGLHLDIGKPEGWAAATNNGTELYVPDGMIADSLLWVYVPDGTRPGNYTINLTARGEGVRSNELKLKVTVEATPLYDAIIKGSNRSAGGYPELNLSAGQSFSLPVRVYNSWDFPISIQASAQVGDDWYHYIDGVPNGRIYVEPGKAIEFAVRSRVPNETYGNFTAKIYLESQGQSRTLLALITVPEPPPPPKPPQSWGGIALTGATAATIALALGTTWVRRKNSRDHAPSSGPSQRSPLATQRHEGVRGAKKKRKVPRRIRF